MSQIPTAEDFERADRYMARIDRNLDVVNRNLSDLFSKLCPASKFNMYLMASDEKKFGAYFFFRNNSDIAEASAKGIRDQLIDSTYAELERQGRGRRDEISVNFEFDSDENVQGKFDGDYYERLH